MDVVNAIAGQLGVGQDKAGGVLGMVLGTVQQHLGKAQGPEASQKFGAAIPELGGLMEQAKSIGGGGALGGLGKLASGLLHHKAAAGGAGVLAEVAAKLAGSGIDLTKLTSIVPLVLPFLSSRLPPDLMATVSGMLGGAARGPSAPVTGGGKVGGVSG